MTAPRAREQRRPPSPPDRLPPRRGGRSSSYLHAAFAAARPAGSARLRATRRGLVGSARALAAAALLALTGALAHPATAEAQTVIDLVSNVGQSRISHSLYRESVTVRRAQVFTAGSSSDASDYTLTGVDIVSASTTAFTAQVCETDASEHPTSTCTPLTVDGGFAEGTVSFTAPADTTLQRGMKYAVWVEPGADEDTHGFQMTEDNDQDAGAAPNWTIANNHETWSTFSSSWLTDTGGTLMQIAIKGYAATGTPSNPTLSVADASATEGGTMTFPVTLSEAATDDVTATWTASFGSNEENAAAADLASTTGTLTIGMGETTGTFTVSTEGDSTDEHDETFTVTLSDPSNAELATDPTATGTITDDDDPPMLSVEYDVSISESSGFVSFPVLITPVSGKTVTVTLTASVESGDTAESPADFTAESHMLTFNPGDVRVSTTFRTVNDSIVEPDETFTVTLSNATNAVLASDPTAKATITNDDTPAAPTDFTATAGDAQVALVWKALASDSGVTGYEYRYKTSGEYLFFWNAISNSAPDEANEDAFTVTGLTNGTDYTFELRAVAGDVKGDTAERGPVTPMATVVLSSDATLSALTVTAAGTDLVTFVSGTTTYTAMVASTVTEVTVTATKNDTGATIDYLDGSDMTLDDADTGAAGHQVAVAVGDNAIKVKVTAADGNATETYTVTVTRAAAAAAPTINEVAVTSTPLLTSAGGSTEDTYGRDETIEVSVTFNEAVTATTGTDFVLSVSGATRAPLLRGSGTATLVFGYTVQAADSDADGIWIGDQDRTLVGDRNSNPQTGTITSETTSVEADLTHSQLDGGCPGRC